jgi:hypothetical protein
MSPQHTRRPGKLTKSLEDWPEKGERERRWLSPSQAALDISESGLVAMLLSLGLPAT